MKKRCIRKSTARRVFSTRWRVHNSAIVSLTVTEKGYWPDAADGQLDLNNPLIKHNLKTRLRRSLRLVTS
ncbi:hypothetical protein ACNKHM_08465 [Shigella sonnei]